MEVTASEGLLHGGSAYGEVRKSSLLLGFLMYTKQTCHFSAASLRGIYFGIHTLMLSPYIELYSEADNITLCFRQDSTPSSKSEF